MSHITSLCLLGLQRSSLCPCWPVPTQRRQRGQASILSTGSPDPISGPGPPWAPPAGLSESMSQTERGLTQVVGNGDPPSPQGAPPPPCALPMGNGYGDPGRPRCPPLPLGRKPRVQPDC